ncbi:MAG: Fic family protein, partial [Campylobacterota bacterium]|nr:Fic family protein [Campylobacterota bacterium]
QIHSLILKNIDADNAGSYRKSNVIISGATHRPPPFLDLPYEMERFVSWYQQNYQNMHPVELASRVHIDFVGIHPFIDGNGRTSRLLMNLELLKVGYPPAVITLADRLEYYNALDTAHTTHNYEPFLELMERVVVKSFEPYFYVLGIE